MTTQKKKQQLRLQLKNQPPDITDKELGNILTETLAKVAEPEPTATQPQPVKIDGRDKTAFMVVMLSRPEGATLKEMAEALGWKENSIRGAMSLYAKKTKATIASEKKDGVRTYYLKANAQRLGFYKKTRIFQKIPVFLFQIIRR